MNDPSSEVADDQPPARLLALQQRFASHLRDPEHVPPPDGIEPRRMAIYRRLFFNNLSNLFARNFPVIRQLYSEPEWQAIIREFMIDHRARTPLFTEIGSEFVDFLDQRAIDQPDQPPWLAELAHWEYLETCVRLDASLLPEQASEPGQSDAELLARSFTINPSLRIGNYRWPVHRIGPDSPVPCEPASDPVLLAVYRRRNDRVAFMQINALTASLLNDLADAPETPIGKLLETLAESLGQPTERVLASGRQLVRTLLEREVLLT